MAKKFTISLLAMIILSLCCGICLAAENGNTISLGNEIEKSIDKTENSMKNVVSGNVLKDSGNMIRDGVNNMENGIENGVRDMGNMVEDLDGNENYRHEDNRNVNAVVGTNNGNYNTTRTSVDQTMNEGINTMTATTWMWIILIVAAITILAAIWYYAMQSNS